MQCKTIEACNPIVWIPQLILVLNQSVPKVRSHSNWTCSFQLYDGQGSLCGCLPWLVTNQRNGVECCLPHWDAQRARVWHRACLLPLEAMLGLTRRPRHEEALPADWLSRVFNKCLRLDQDDLALAFLVRPSSQAWPRRHVRRRSCCHWKHGMKHEAHSVFKGYWSRPQ